VVRASACSARDSGPGRPGLRPAHRLVPLLPRRGRLLPGGLPGLGRPCHRGLPRGDRLLPGAAFAAGASPSLASGSAAEARASRASAGGM
jgi:hypothetical protein